MLKRNPFIAPATPVLRTVAPAGPDWIHELKFGGVRVQLHKEAADVIIFSQTGRDITRRYPDICDAMHSLPCNEAIFDAELTACHTPGKPNFVGLMKRQNSELCVWAFDLLRLDETDLRRLPLWERKRELQSLLVDADEHALRFSDDFDDPTKLLEVAEKWGLEGITSKNLDQPYRSGCNQGWIKVKTRTWRNANTEWWTRFASSQS